MVYKYFKSICNVNNSKAVTGILTPVYLKAENVDFSKRFWASMTQLWNGGFLFQTPFLKLYAFLTFPTKLISRKTKTNFRCCYNAVWSIVNESSR